jgi:hypothetical protein
MVDSWRRVRATEESDHMIGAAVKRGRARPVRRIAQAREEAEPRHRPTPATELVVGERLHALPQSHIK